MASLLLRRCRPLTSSVATTGHAPRFITACYSTFSDEYQRVSGSVVSPVLWVNASPTSHLKVAKAPQSTHHQVLSTTNHSFSSLAHHDDDDDECHYNDGPLLPTKHSRNLPPPVCPPSHLSAELSSILDAPVGSLITYEKSPNTKELKSVQDEINDAYYASDGVVQHVEYILRGLNAQVSSESFVARSLERGSMMTALNDEEEREGGNGSSAMSRQDCFHSMLAILDRMEAEGDAYVELRKRVRSQLSVGDDSDGSSSDSSSSDDEDNTDESSFNKWTQDIEQRMNKAGLRISNQNNNNGATMGKTKNEESIEMNQEDYQFGAPPGITVHMFDLVLDAMACLCKEQYSQGKTGSDEVDLIEVLGVDSPPPPAVAKEILDKVLNLHWMDGGDIGLGHAGDEVDGVAQGIGTGAGTGSGSLASHSSLINNIDIRTCPTPMTFNAVLRIAAEFDPKMHASMVDHAQVLSGTGNTKKANTSEESLKREQERLRDITIDAAFSTYSRMKYCSALTLRSLKHSTKNATSRSALKKQAKMLAMGVNPDYKDNSIVSGRNSATYTYLLQTVVKCVPPSLSRGNIAFGLYYKACVQEGVMDEQLVKAMMSVGGYNGADLEDAAAESSPSIANGPIFDAFLQKEVGGGVASALEKGRSLRQDRNYKLRRHAEWDDAY